MARLKNQLPKKLSAVLEIALKDMAKCKRSKNFAVSLGKWFTPAPASDFACKVCLAGSVLAQTHKIDPSGAWLNKAGGNQNYPAAFVRQKLITKHDKKCLVALDQLRRGLIHNALGTMGQQKLYKRLPQVMDVNFSYYSEYWGANVEYLAFRRSMNKILKTLKTVGA